MKEGDGQIFLKYTQSYLREVGLAGVQGDHGGVMGGQNLPEEGEGLRQRSRGAQIRRGQLHLSRQGGSQERTGERVTSS